MKLKLRSQNIVLHPEEAIEEARQRRLEMAVSKDAPGVEQRARSAGSLENFLSCLFLCTSGRRVSNDSKGLGLPGAEKSM